ncbi:MAG: DMT family transporter [Thermaurantiacus sp.]
MGSPRAIAQFVILCLVWGTTWLVIKLQLGVVDPSWSVAYRFLIAGAALLAWCLVRGENMVVPRSAWGFLAIFGALQFVFNFNLVYRAELYIPSGLPAVAFALLMIPNAMFAWAFLGMRVSRRFILGCAVAIVGVGLLFANELSLPDERGAVALGLALTAAAVLSASIANVMQASPQARRLPPLGGLAWAMLLGGLLNAVLAWAIVGPPSWDPRPQYVLGLLMLGVVASALAFALYFDLLRAVGPAEAAWIGIPIPIIAMALSTQFEGYRWTPMAIAGAASALVGLAIALRPGAARPATQT